MRAPKLVAALCAAAAIAFAVSTAQAGDHGRRASDAEVRKLIIAESIADYPGPCACPYQRARNGSRCGARSAYDRPNGYAPLCFASDVSDAMVAEYRRDHDLE